jgi:hypothetical protein
MKRLRGLRVSLPAEAWALGAAALVVAGLAVAVTAATAPADVEALGLEVGIGGWVVLAVALVWRPWFLAVALAALAAPVALGAVVEEGGTAVVPLAALLVATGELAGWAYDARSAVPEARALRVARLATTAGLTVGAAAVAGAILALGGLPAPGGALPVLIGAAAALALLAFAAFRRW